MDTQLNLFPLSKPELNLTDQIKVQFAFVLLKTNAANSYFIRVLAGDILDTGNALKTISEQE